MTHKTDVPKTSDLAGFAAREAGQVPQPPAWATAYSFPIPTQLHVNPEEEAARAARPRTTHEQIESTCNAIRDMLLAKNRKYGDSALDPVRIFSRATPVEQILVRLDDKLSRLRSAQADEDEDVVDDLIGYLVLLKIARLR